MAGYMKAAGFVMEGTSCLPCARFSRGSVANNFFVASPRLWGVTADTRIESAGSGGSQVEVAWTINTVSQIVIYTETRYWRKVLRELRAALETGTIGPEESNRAAGLSLVCLLAVIAVALALAFWIGLVVLNVGHDQAGVAARIVVMLAVTFAVLLLFRDWRGIRP